MTKVEKLGREVERLSREELAAFREWFRAYDAEVWDRRIEEDVRAGKLDELADTARLAALYGQSAEEDQALAEEGMADYTAGLIREDDQ